MNSPLTEPQRQQVLATLAENQLIQAIKLYREFTGAGLAEAKAAVEAMQAEARGVAPQASSTPSVGLESQGLSAERKRAIEQEISVGRKINAIKLYREATGVGLKEAKDVVEAMEAELRQSSPQRFNEPSARSGCLSILLLVLLPAALLVWRSR